MIKQLRGYPRRVWELIPGRRNEPLDCRVYARAAASVLGVDRWSDKGWDKLERHLGRTPAPQKPRGRQRQRGEAFGRWRRGRRQT